MNLKNHKALADLPTPALVLDLDVLDANLSFMQGRADSLGVRLRPHVKTHKCLEIGELQRAAGARGLTVSTLEEARAFADAGFTDILWAFPLNPSRLDEVIELSQQVELGVTVDSRAAVDVLEASGAPLSVWLEIDCGYGRSGIPHTDGLAIALARRIAGSASLELCGCLTHAGHTYHGDSAAHITALAEEERRAMVEVGDRIRATGVDPGSLSLGSTPGMSLVENLDGIDEARPGNYAFYDYTQSRLGTCDVSRCAVTVLSSIVSATAGRDSAIADCGALVLSKDLGPDDPPHYGRVFQDLDGGDLSTALITSVSQEHARVFGSYAVGQKIRVLPNHSCLTVAHFDYYDVVRRATVIGRWKIWRSRGSKRVPRG